MEYERELKLALIYPWKYEINAASRATRTSTASK